MDELNNDFNIIRILKSSKILNQIMEYTVLIIKPYVYIYLIINVIIVSLLLILIYLTVKRIKKINEF